MSAKNEIITDFNAYIKDNGGKNARYGWYVGVTADAKRRLFTDHNVREQGDCWIYRTANSAAIARSVEKAYIDAGYKGGTGGGDDTARMVYAYRIEIHTKE